MKIVFVDFPVIQLKNKKIYVQDERLRFSETFQEWVKRKKAEILEKNNSIGQHEFTGVYVYDWMPIGDIVGAPKAVASIIRFAYMHYSDSFE